jgi:hypothetical protein
LSHLSSQIFPGKRLYRQESGFTGTLSALFRENAFTGRKEPLPTPAAAFRRSGAIAGGGRQLSVL